MSCHYAHLSQEYAQTWREGRVESSVETLLPEREIPERLICASLEKSKDFSLFRSYANLASSLFDMAVHNAKSHEDLEKMNLAETFNRIRKDVRLLHGPETLGESLDWGCSYAHSRHLSGSYDAQYYTYLRSETPALSCVCLPGLISS
jgi:metallopeptidase MepB